MCLFQQKLIFDQKSNFNTNYIQNSAVSRPILKQVYQLGIPNLDPQTLKGAKTNSAKNRQTIVHDQNHWQEQCFELFRMQNCQQKIFFTPGPHWGRLADYPAAKQFFSWLHSSKNQNPWKLMDTVLQNPTWAHKFSS